MHVQHPEPDVNARVAGRPLLATRVNLSGNQTITNWIPTPSIQKQKTFSTAHVGLAALVSVPQIELMVPCDIICLEYVPRPDVATPQDVG
ncbi:MAG: hypothetical protein NT154_13520 [Verrucomicrobia bacterium]|nr:hypothetical protein [Verrucomicrobiota bacterium]